MEVSNNFDVYDIPMDTMWLDIEYTDGKRYLIKFNKFYNEQLKMQFFQIFYMELC